MAAISEQNFRTVLDALWAVYTKSAGLIDTLECVGLDVDADKPKEPGMAKFHELYAMQGIMSPVIVKVIGIDTRIPGSNERQIIVEELDQFFSGVRNARPGSEVFPEEFYQKLLEILTVSGRARLPWAG